MASTPTYAPPPAPTYPSGHTKADEKELSPKEWFETNAVVFVVLLFVAAMLFVFCRLAIQEARKKRESSGRAHTKAARQQTQRALESGELEQRLRRDLQAAQRSRPSSQAFATAAPSMQMVSVQVPAGAVAGQKVTITLSDQQQAEVTVPAGAAPGTTFLVPITQPVNASY